MTTITDCPSDPADCARWPTYELTYEFDDPEAPSTVTLFPAGPDTLQTEWITMDIGHSVSVPDAR